VWPDTIEIRDADGQLIRVVTRARALEIVEQGMGEAEARNGEATAMDAGGQNETRAR
jgi:hypothetical protein